MAAKRKMPRAMIENAADMRLDKKLGIKEMSARDMKMDMPKAKKRKGK